MTRRVPTYGHIPSTGRRAPGSDYEAGLLFYAPPIQQGAHTAQSALRTVAACIWVILHEGRTAGQKADAAAGNCPAYSRTGGANQRLPFLHGYRAIICNQRSDE